MKKCLILDYGVGNVASVRTFFRENGYLVTFGNTITDIEDTDLLILPGVGSFETAAKNMNNGHIANEIQNRHSAKMPILGICLGFQLLTNNSSESTISTGLGIFHGVTTRLEEFSRIGWGRIDFDGDYNPLEDDYFYFNHSFGSYDSTGSRFNARSGLSHYRALVIEDNTVGLQFHPERSQNSGKNLLAWLEAEVWSFGD